MGTLNLAGRISLDASPFHGTLKSVEAGAEKFAHKLKHQIGGTLLGAFGVHALIHMGKEAMNNAHIITQMAERFNLTTDEVQLLQKEADKTGVSFESLVKDAGQLEETLSRLRGGDVIFSRQAIETLDNAHEVIKEFKGAAAERLAGLMGLGNSSEFLSQRQREFLEADAAKKRGKGFAFQERVDASIKHMAVQDEILANEKELDKLRFEAMSKEEKLNELLRQRAVLWDKRASEPNTPEGSLRNEVASVRLDNAIAALRASKDTVVNQRGLSPLRDSLTSVGNFLGSDPNSGVVRQLSDMRKELIEIRRNTARQAQSGAQFPL